MLGPYIVRKRWFTPPVKGFTGIALYPFVFLRRGYSATIMRHELIHVWQVRKVGWLRFYLTYLLDACKYEYREIPAEVEAYANQHDPAYLPVELEKLVRADPDARGSLT